MTLRPLLARIGITIDDLTEDEEDLIRYAAGYTGDRHVSQVFIIHPRGSRPVIYQPTEEKIES